MGAVTKVEKPPKILIAGRVSSSFSKHGLSVILERQKFEGAYVPVLWHVEMVLTI
jgi:hypothetical protein